MSRIHIITDSSCGLSQEEAKAFGITLMAMPIAFNNTSYLIGEEISSKEIVEKMRNQEFAKTAQVPLGFLTETIESLLKIHEEVIYLCLSENLSSGYSTARALSKNYDNRFHVPSIKSVEVLLAITINHTLKLIEEGLSCQEICTILEKNADKTWAAIVPYDLTTLQKGGRITPAAAALGNLLKIQPILKIEEGRVDAYSKVRTLNKAYHEAMMATIQGIDEAQYDQYDWAMLYIDNKDVALEWLEKYQQLIKQPITLREFCPVIFAHTGLKTIGFGRTAKL